MTNRQTDPPETAKEFRERRVARTVFGFALSAAAVTAFFLTPDRSTRVDIAIAGAILLGGAYVDLPTIKEVVKIVTPFWPRK